ncbi:ABC transporter ATP-binding protein [Silvimonas iriomotensis]|uniref:ABC transporter ATP-binding protein n=1 Tax=Silvimonas iriomotensis TaxID=449662 RepID=A0ABQ2PAT6_9NEIS|nr:ABC transporter ATP-binding protein [Silvimonas iriomotensis]GGP22638.1 ABC transporter ATP-binding protein [Silvimonas iriomotensis]
MTINDDDLTIRFAGVSKIYHTYSTPRHRLLEILSGGKRNYAHETKALDDVSFSLKRGGRLGILGENGSGKSTLLKILAGVLTPSSGTVEVKGRISALLELGAGFNPELPGAENIQQFCMLHGMNKDEIEQALPEIISFSELREAINHPVKTYSSGMSVRLGFACAVYVKPEILIVDEALSVGDAYFQNKCLHKIKSLLDEGTTFIYVTHAADAIRSLCNEGIWMERGKLRHSGTSAEVGAAYQAEVFRRMANTGLVTNTQTAMTPLDPEGSEKHGLLIDHARHRAFEDRVLPLRTGSGEARIQDIALVNTDGADTDSVEFNAKLRVRVFYQVESPVSEPCTLTLGVTDSSGRQVLHFNSASQGVFISRNGTHTLRFIEFEFCNQLCPGEYGLIAGIGILSRNPINNGQSLVEQVIDYCVGGSRFSVRFPQNESGYDLWGLVHIPYSVSDFTLD